MRIFKSLFRSEPQVESLDVLRAQVAALEVHVKDLVARLRKLESSDFALNREDYLRTKEDLQRGNPGIPLFHD